MITSFLLLQATRICILDQFPPSIRSGTDHWPLVNIRCYCVVVLLICVVGARPRGELSLTNISIMSKCPVSSIQCPPPSLHRGHHVAVVQDRMATTTNNKAPFP